MTNDLSKTGITPMDVIRKRLTRNDSGFLVVPVGFDFDSLLSDCGFRRCDIFKGEGTLCAEDTMRLIEQSEPGLTEAQIDAINERYGFHKIG